MVWQAADSSHFASNLVVHELEIEQIKLYFILKN